MTRDGANRHRGHALPFIVRHAPFVVVFLAGCVLRLDVWLAYKPAIIVLPDSLGYLQTALFGQSGAELRPDLYPGFLHLFVSGNHLSLIPALQHLLILAVALLLYTVLCRLGVHPFVGALSMIPFLLDGYQLDLEQHLLSEALFESFLVVGIVLLVWRARAPWWMYALGAGCLSLGALTRFAGLALLPVAVLYMLVRRVGWIRLCAGILGAVIPLIGYAFYNDLHGRSFRLTNSSGQFLYAGKVARFADCTGVALPKVERQLCIRVPPDKRHSTYAPWNSGSPLASLQIPKDMSPDEVVRSFSVRMIRHQPLDYLRLVGVDFLHFFSWQPPPQQEPFRVTRWRFFVHFDQVKAVAGPIKGAHYNLPPNLGIPPAVTVNKNLASFLRTYQNHAYSYGALVTILMLLGLAGGLFGYGRQADRDVRVDALLLVVAPLALFLFPAALASFHFRYAIPAIPFLGPAGGLGATLLWRRAALYRR